MDKKMAYQYLNKNKMLNIDMIDGLNSGEAEVIYAAENGVLLYNISGGSYLISADGDIERILACVDKNARIFMAHQDFYIPLLKRQFGLDTEMRCYMAVYTKPAAPEFKTDYEIRQLTIDYLDVVLNTYSYIGNKDYIARRIQDKFMYGAFLGDELLGYIGTHDEGAMGMLEVMPQHRRKGIGYALEAYLINVLLQKGRAPYAHVVEDNQASLALQKKLGMDILDQKISWVFK